MSQPFDNVFDAVNAFVTTQATNTVNQQNQTISQATTVYRNPTWVCRYPLGDVSFPEADFLAHVVGGNTGAASNGTAHTHTFDVANWAAQAVAIGGYCPPDQSLGGYITISQSLVMDTLALTIRKSTATTLNNVYIEVFKENTDLSLTRVLTTGDIAASLGTSFAYFEVSITGGFLVQAGERYVIRARNSSSVATGIEIGCHLLSSVSPSTGFSTGFGSTVATSYSAGDAAIFRNGGLVMPFLLFAAKNPTITPQSHSDDFNRSSLGGVWLTKSNTGSNQLGTSSNKAAFTGSTDGNQNAIYTKVVTTDNAEVSGTISDNLLSITGAYCGFLLHSNSDMSSLVYLAVNNVGAKIYSGSSTTLTQRATITRSFNDGNWKLYYNSATTTYTALFNEQDVGLSWNDSGALKPRGVDYRYGGLRISRSTLFNAGRIDNWTFRDRSM